MTASPTAPRTIQDRINDLEYQAQQLELRHTATKYAAVTALRLRSRYAKRKASQLREQIRQLVLQQHAAA